MAGDHFGAINVDMILEPRPAGGEHLVEHGAIGEHGRPAIDCGAIDVHAAGLAAHPGLLFEHRDVMALRRQQRSTGQPANPGTDDGDSRYGPSSPSCIP
jgi:hypothetical protein